MHEAALPESMLQTMHWRQSSPDQSTNIDSCSSCTSSSSSSSSAHSPPASFSPPSSSTIYTDSIALQPVHSIVSSSLSLLDFGDPTLTEILPEDLLLQRAMTEPGSSLMVPSDAGDAIFLSSANSFLLPPPTTAVPAATTTTTANITGAASLPEMLPSTWKSESSEQTAVSCGGDACSILSNSVLCGMDDFSSFSSSLSSYTSASTNSSTYPYYLSTTSCCSGGVEGVRMLGAGSTLPLTVAAAVGCIGDHRPLKDLDELEKAHRKHLKAQLRKERNKAAARRSNENKKKLREQLEKKSLELWEVNLQLQQDIRELRHKLRHLSHMQSSMRHVCCHGRRQRLHQIAAT